MGMSSSNPKSPRVLVSGASISGLTTAYWLARYGFDVTVVERAPHLRPGGHALDMRGPALEVAERMGALSEMRDRSTKLTGIAVVDANGDELFRSTESTLTGGTLDSPDVEILRDDLCRVLQEAVDAQVQERVNTSSATSSRRWSKTIRASTSRSSLRRPVASSS